MFTCVFLGLLSSVSFFSLRALPLALKVFSSRPCDNLPSNEFAKKEDSGVQDIDGVAVHGVRETQTIAPENSSGAENRSGKKIVVTDEYWYSDELRINLVIKHSDPRTGAVSMKVVQIDRSEPNAAFFEVPDGYKPATSSDSRP